MDTIRKDIIEKLSKIYEDSEAKLMVKYLIDDLFSNAVIDTFVLNKAVERLMNHEPLQYVTGKAYFLDYVLYVDRNVLIPRPETEELVNESIRLINQRKLTNVIEVGTGSGCIAVSIKDKCPHVDVTAMDICQGALKVASTNAKKYDTKINFIKSDFLNEANWQSYGQPDIVVSNPPYISIDEKDTMHENVLLHEPHIALFAGQDPMVFYKKLAKFAAANQAMCICEINEFFPMDTKQVFVDAGYENVSILKDMQGKSRVVKAEVSI